MTAIVGGFASRRSQISAASRGGASGSMSATSSPASTTVEVTSGSQSKPSCHAGCCTRQIQRPGATSRISKSVLAMAGSVDGFSRMLDGDLDALGAVRSPALAEKRTDNGLGVALRPGTPVVRSYLLDTGLVRTAEQRPPF